LASLRAPVFLGQLAPKKRGCGCDPPAHCSFAAPLFILCVCLTLYSLHTCIKLPLGEINEIQRKSEKIPIWEKSAKK
jgi:hypothetical protein